MKDHKSRLLRGNIADNQFRLFVADTTDIVQKARDIHDLFPLPTIFLGRLITAAALMSSELKAPHSEITLRIDAEGALKGAIVIVNKEGDIRAFPYEPKLMFAEAQDNFLVGKHLGKGSLSVIRKSVNKAPYTGTVQLIDAEIASDVAAYYEQSEQSPSAVNLGVLIDPSAKIRAAGGFIIQQLPNADLAIVSALNQNLEQTPNISDLMDMGLSIEDILHRFVLKNISFQISQESSLRYHCNCSKKSFAKALILLGKKELENMREGINPVCHYCNRNYQFSSKDINNLIRTISEQK